MIDPVVAFSARAALAMLFAFAAWHKLSDHKRFSGVVRAYRMAPRGSEALVSRLLPLAEAAVALGLCYAPTREVAAIAAIGLLSVYSLAIAVNLAIGNRDIDCGCFAANASVPLSGWLLGRNALLIASAVLIALPTRPRTLVWVDALTVVATLVTLSLLWLAGRRLAQTGPLLRRLGGPT